MENLLSKIYKIASQRKGFSFLTMVGQTTREMTHSAFIAELLNPCGCHGEGSLFLDIFIEELSKIKTVIFNSNTAKVCIEKDFGPERENEDGHFGGRIDIYLRDDKGSVIVIENKVYAGDQDFQLERYYNSTEKKADIIYLTLDGRKPSAKSLGSLSCDKVLNLSYSWIIEWLKSCISHTKNELLQSTMEQYANTVEGLCSDLKIRETILSSSANMKASLAIKTNIDDARDMATTEFMMMLSEELHGGEVRKVGKEWVFSLGEFEVCIEWRLFVISKRKYENKPQEWKYVTIDGEKINFHTFEGIASRWLDEPKEKFIEEVASAIRCVKNELETAD